MKSLPRRRARELALKVLYSLDVNPEVDAGAALTTYYDRFAREGGRDEDEDADEQAPGDQPAAGEALDRGYAEALVREVTRHRPELDDLLTQVSRNWRIERMARVERTILRIALYELKHRQDVPAPVAISEAIELAKRFGAADAPAFVNGLLDSALQTLGTAPGGANK
jgi:N utilization substance protein B